MSLHKINFLMVSFLVLIFTGSFLYTHHIAKEYFEKQTIVLIKGDILELGYSVVQVIEHDGPSASENLLYRALATHREYHSLSLFLKKQTLITTDKSKQSLGKQRLPMNKMLYKSMDEKTVFVHEFKIFLNGNMEDLSLIVDLEETHLLKLIAEVDLMVNQVLVYLSILLIIFFLLLYYFYIRPVDRLCKSVKDEEFSSNNYFIKEYHTLFTTFKEKHTEALALNQTLEEQVMERTQDLNHTNTLYKEAQRLAHLGHWEWCIATGTLSWSDEIYVMLGFEPQEFTSTYEVFLHTIHRDDREIVEEGIKKALETGEEYSVTHRVVLLDGSEKVLYEHGRVELDKEKKPLRMIGTVQDITQSYEKEKRLELTAQLLSSVKDSVFAYDVLGSFFYLNEEAYTSKGYTEEEMMKMKMQELYYPYEKYGSDLYKENREEFHKQIDERGYAVFEASQRCKSGKVTSCEITTTWVQNEGGDYFISTARDITDRKLLHENLERSEKEYRTLVENSQVGIFKTKLNGDFLYVNDTLVQILEYESPQDLYKIKSVTLYKNPEEHYRFLQDLVRKRNVDSLEQVLLTKSAKEKIITMSAHMENDVISGIIIDITEAKKAMEAVVQLSRAIEEIDDILMITDRSGVLTFVNDAYVRHTGYTRDKCIGRNASILKSGKQDLAFYKNMWAILPTGKTFRGLFINRKKDGDLYYEEKTISSIKDKNGEIVSYISTGKDVTDMIEMHKRMEELASIDPLTGIFNRYMFDKMFKEELERIKRYNHPLTLIMFDIDHFKGVNDAYGHDIGDAVLTHIVEIVKTHIRTTDVFARWGGEEFLILCPETDRAEAALLAEKLRASIEATNFEKVGKVTSSFGVTLYRDKESKETFIKCVDEALYQAKDAGRNTVCVI